MPDVFIIAGCNGAGKTTASYTVLPELLHIKEFVNADEIARGLSPFQPETVAIEAGKIMLRRLAHLLEQKHDFAFETTLSSRTFVGFIHRAREAGYTVNLIFYWLDSVELAQARVKARVLDGGHNIPMETIVRRYHAGIKNFLKLYADIVDYWLLMDNSKTEPTVIAESQGGKRSVHDNDKWMNFTKQSQ